MAEANYNAIIALPGAYAIRFNASNAHQDYYEFSPAEGALLNNFPAGMFSDTSIYWIERVRGTFDGITAANDAGQNYVKVAIGFHKGSSIVGQTDFLGAMPDDASWILINETTEEWLIWPANGSQGGDLGTGFVTYQVIPSYISDTSGLNQRDVQAVAEDFDGIVPLIAGQVFQNGLINSELVVGLIPNNTFRPSFDQVITDVDGSVEVRAGSPTVGMAADAQAIVSRDTSLEVRAGSPTVSMDADSAPVVDRDAALTVRAGLPTVTIAAEVLGITNRDGAFTVRAGNPTVRMSADVEQQPIPAIVRAAQGRVAIPLVHLGWETTETVSGHAVPSLDGWYEMGAIDTEATTLSGPAPAFAVTYDDGSDEWIVFDADHGSIRTRAIADGATGTFDALTLTTPGSDIEWKLQLVSAELTAIANGLPVNLAALGDASGGTLALYANPDTAKNQRVQYRSATEDFDWYADVPFLRFATDPKIPNVDSRPQLVTGKDGLRSLHPFRVPDANAEFSITVAEFTAQEWQVDHPVAIIEEYNDGDGATTWRSQMVGHIERPRYEERLIGYYLHLSILGNTSSLLSDTVETALHPSITARAAIAELLDEADWPTVFRDLRTSSLNVPIFNNWWESGRSHIAAIQAVLDTAGPPSQMYEDRKGRLVVLGNDWVVNITRDSVEVSADAGINVYDSRWNDTDLESQVNYAVESVSTWTESLASQDLWMGAGIVVPSGTTVRITARFRDPVVSVDDPVAADYTSTGAGTPTVTVENVKAQQAEVVVEATSGDVTITTIVLHGVHLTDRQQVSVVADQASVDGVRRREWSGEILPSTPPLDAQSLLNHIVRSYDEAIVSSTIRIRAEDDYAVVGYLEHLRQVNSIDRRGQVFDGFIRQMRRRWTPEGTWLELESEQDAGVLDREASVWRFGISTFGSSAFLWV